MNSSALLACVLLAITQTSVLGRSNIQAAAVTTYTYGICPAGSISSTSSEITCCTEYGGSSSTAGGNTFLQGTRAASTVSTGRRRRSTPDEPMQMINTTMDVAVPNLDINCDGYVHVIEWLHVGTLQYFMGLLERYDTNGDSRLSAEELSTHILLIDPVPKMFMVVPMEEYEDMKAKIDGDAAGSGSKGRRDRS